MNVSATPALKVEHARDNAFRPIKNLRVPSLKPEA